MDTLLKRMQMGKKGRKKGFTLIELIVVLVILSILAAIAIPALTGYIDKANQRAAIAQGALVRTALQAIASDSYTTGGGIDPAGTITFTDATILNAGAGTNVAANIFGYNPISGPSGSATIMGEVVALTGVGKPSPFTSINGIKYTNNVVSDFVVALTSGRTVTFAAGTYTVS